MSAAPKLSLLWLLDLVLECVAGRELGHLGGGDVYPLLGLRVDALAGVALLHVELAFCLPLPLALLSPQTIRGNRPETSCRLNP